jgi:hypothetical protein
MNDPAPITYRQLHEHAAGMGLCDEFFTTSGIDPDAPVTCSCSFNTGHEPWCDLVYAQHVRRELNGGGPK